jgi:hypothetical protein
MLPPLEIPPAVPPVLGFDPPVAPLAPLMPEPLPEIAPPALVPPPGPWPPPPGVPPADRSLQLENDIESRRATNVREAKHGASKLISVAPGGTNQTASY